MGPPSATGAFRQHPAPVIKITYLKMLSLISYFLTVWLLLDIIFQNVFLQKPPLECYWNPGQSSPLAVCQILQDKSLRRGRIQEIKGGEKAGYLFGLAR